MKYFLLLFCLVLTGCAGTMIDQYKNTKPELVIEDYFNGHVIAQGVFQDRFGKVRRTFTVDIKGEWDEDTQSLKLIEDFLYNDGQTEQRIWIINKTAENTYTGTADGVIGTAKGESEGQAFNFRYKFALPVDGNIWNVTFDDWMYLLNEKTLFNKATIRRYGIRLGDVYITFQKQ